MMLASKKLANKKITPSVTKAIKASPAGMFPAAAAKAGITMGSKLGQAITKSPTGKLPAQMAQQTSAKMAKRASEVKNQMRSAVKAGPSSSYTDMQYRGPLKSKAPFDMDKFKKMAGRSK